MTQEFIVPAFMPKAGSTAIDEAVTTPDGINAYWYVGRTGIQQLELDEIRKRWTAFLDGLNEVKDIVAKAEEEEPARTPSRRLTPAPTAPSV